jgi:ComF family protein
MYKINDLFQSVINRLFPQPCFLCGEITAQAICAECVNDLPYIQIACTKCGINLPISDICGNCASHPPLFHQAKSLFSYSYPMDILIQAAKFEKNFAVLRMLGDLMGQHFKQEKPPNVLIPIPLHPNRLQERGYNQAREIAKRISYHTKIEWNDSLCQRVKNTPQQARLSARKRRRNLKDAFAVTHLPSHWQHIVLIDDVMTTGSTASELSKMLFNAGAQKIDVWCCARA